MGPTSDAPGRVRFYFATDVTDEDGVTRVLEELPTGYLSTDGITIRAPEEDEA